MPLSKIQLTGEGSRAQKLYDFLRNAILDGTLEPNERLVEETIAAMASVSRTPVREAIRRLEADDLIQNTGQGLVVGSCDPDDLADLCIVRETLEGLASRLAARSRSEIEVLSLLRILNDYRKATELQDVLRLVALNHAFHETIWQATHNRYLFHQLVTLRSHIEHLQKTTLDIPSRQQEALSQHELLLDAIVNRDADEAERLTCQHFREAMALRMTMDRFASGNITSES
jgi:DNA-binding GntR family transcriptional regulator